MDKVNFDDIEMMLNNFKQLNKQIHQILAKQTEMFGLLPEQIKLLLKVLQHENINQNKLAKELHITKATLSVRIQRLEKLGYIEKVHDEHDKRNFLLKLTKKGETFFEESYEVVKKYTVSIFDDVTKKEIMTINEVIDKIRDNLNRFTNEES